MTSSFPRCQTWCCALSRQKSSLCNDVGGSSKVSCAIGPKSLRQTAACVATTVPKLCPMICVRRGLTPRLRKAAASIFPWQRPTRKGSPLNGETLTAFQSQLNRLKLSPQRHLSAFAPEGPKGGMYPLRQWVPTVREDNRRLAGVDHVTRMSTARINSATRPFARCHLFAEPQYSARSRLSAQPATAKKHVGGDRFPSVVPGQSLASNRIANDQP